MPDQEVIAYLAVFGGIALFTTALTIVGVRLRRASDADSLGLRARDVVEQCRDLLAGPDFLWSVWHDTARAAEMRMLIRNARDEVVSTVTAPSVVLDGVVRRFDHAGRHYEIRKPALLSNRTCLHEAGAEAVILCAEHGTLGTRFLQADGLTEVCTIPVTSVLKRFRPVLAGGREIGRMIIGLKRNSHAGVLDLPDSRVPALARVFLIASL